MPSWTYEQISEAYGITVDSARALARRKRWTRRPGNDGRARVDVPEEEVPSPPEPSRDDRTDGHSDGHETIGFFMGRIRELETELKTARERAEQVPVLKVRLEAAEALRVVATEEKLNAAIDRLAETSREMLAIERERMERASRSWWKRLVS
jgi:hypothetical protein